MIIRSVKIFGNWNNSMINLNTEGTILNPSKNRGLMKYWLLMVYDHEKHAFINGCSTRTMVYWWTHVSGIYFHHKELRKFIIENSSKMWRNSANCWCFEIKE